SNVVVERRSRRWHRLVLGNPNATDCATWTGNAECRAFRLLKADALEDGVDSEAVGEIAHTRDRLVASLADNISCAKLSRQCDPIGMTPQNDDLLGTKSPGGNHAAQADGTVSDNGYCLPGTNFGDDRCMMACCHHV